MKLSPSKKMKRSSSLLKSLIALFGSAITIVSLSSCGDRLEGVMPPPIPSESDSTENVDSLEIEENIQ